VVFFGGLRRAILIWRPHSERLCRGALEIVHHVQCMQQECRHDGGVGHSQAFGARPDDAIIANREIPFSKRCGSHARFPSTVHDLAAHFHLMIDSTSYRIALDLEPRHECERLRWVNPVLTLARNPSTRRKHDDFFFLYRTRSCWNALSACQIHSGFASLEYGEFGMQIREIFML
jgi:hypothetical protein